MPALPRFLLKARCPLFLPAALVPVLVGTAWGVRKSHAIDLPACGLAALAMLVLVRGAGWIDARRDPAVPAVSAVPARLVPAGGVEAAAALGAALPVLVCHWLQAGWPSSAAWLGAAIVGAWTAALSVTAGEHPAARSLAARLGEQRAPSLYVSLQAVASALMLALGWLFHLPAWAVAPPLLFMLAALAAAPLMGSGPSGRRAAGHVTLAIHTLGGLCLAGAAFLD